MARTNPPDLALKELATRIYPHKEYVAYWAHPNLLGEHLLGKRLSEFPDGCVVEHFCGADFTVRVTLPFLKRLKIALRHGSGWMKNKSFRTYVQFKEVDNEEREEWLD